MIRIIGHRVRRPRRHEIERFPISLRQVLLDRFVERERGRRGLTLVTLASVFWAPRFCDLELLGERLEQGLRLRGLRRGQRHRSERRNGSGQSGEPAHDPGDERELRLGEGRCADRRWHAVGGLQRVLIARQEHDVDAQVGPVEGLRKGENGKSLAGFHDPEPELQAICRCSSHDLLK